MNIHLPILKLIAVLFFAYSASAHATYMFSYENSEGNVLSGKLDGMLQADSDSIIVTAMFDIKMNGEVAVIEVNVPFPGCDELVPGSGICIKPLTISYIESLAERELGAGVYDPIVTLSGDFMDIYACEDSDCNENIAIISNFPGLDFDVVDSTVLTQPYILLKKFEDTFESSRWSIAEVPEPYTLALLTVGLVGIGFTRRMIKA